MNPGPSKYQSNALPTELFLLDPEDLHCKNFIEPDPCCAHFWVQSSFARTSPISRPIRNTISIHSNSGVAIFSNMRETDDRWAATMCCHYGLPLWANPLGCSYELPPCVTAHVKFCKCCFLYFFCMGNVI